MIEALKIAELIVRILPTIIQVLHPEKTEEQHKAIAEDVRKHLNT